MIGRIYRGVLIGLNEAFVIDRAIRDRLIAEDPRSAEVIKPFLAGRDIKRYEQPRSDKFLIFTRRGIEVESYPAILNHLNQYRERLEPKPKGFKGKNWPGRKAGTYKWYEIQDAVDYYAEFEKNKIIYPNICAQPEFTIDSDLYYSNQKTYIITEFDIGVLGILNSSLMMFLFKNVLPTLRGGYFEPSVKYFSHFPIVRDTSEKLNDLVTLLLKIYDRSKELIIIEQIDQFVFELYQLTADEICVITNK